MLQAIIFDFDGVIADTEPHHHRAFVGVLDGRLAMPSWETYLSDYLGLNDATFLRRLFEESGRQPDEREMGALQKRKDDAYRRILAEGIPLAPGVEAFVRSMRERVPLAICSGAKRVEIEAILRHAGLIDAFEHIVSTDDVPRSKPDPAGFIRAFELLRAAHGGLTPATCLAIEDSAHGVVAAKAAGMRVLQVCPHPIGEFAVPADRKVKDLTEVSDSLLAEMMTQGRGAI